MIGKEDHKSSIKREIRCCIDLGSSYFRLLVVRQDETGSYSAVREEREYIGWGEDIVRGGRVSERSISNARDALGRLLGKTEGCRCEGMRIVGTNVLRSAENSREVIARLQRTAPVMIEVLSPEGEAAMGMAGAASLLDGETDILLVDAGGTSTEVAWGKGDSFRGGFSLPLGTHRVAYLMTRSKMTGERAAPGCTDIRRVRRTIISIIVEQAGARAFRGGIDSLLPDASENPTILFTGGTAVSLAILERFMKRRDPSFLELEELGCLQLEMMARRLRPILMSSARYRLPLARERIDLILPGVVLVISLMGWLGVDSFRAVARDLRWGVVLSEGVLPGRYLADE